MIRPYILPKFPDPDGSGYTCAVINLEPIPPWTPWDVIGSNWMLIFADVSIMQNNYLASFSPIVFPINLNAAIAVNLNSIKAALEDKIISGSWLHFSTKYNEIVELLKKISLLSYKYYELTGNYLFYDRALNTNITDLIQLQDAFNQLGFGLITPPVITFGGVINLLVDAPLVEPAIWNAGTGMSGMAGGDLDLM